MTKKGLSVRTVYIRVTEDGVRKWVNIGWISIITVRASKSVPIHWGEFQAIGRPKPGWVDSGANRK